VALIKLFVLEPLSSKQVLYDRLIMVVWMCWIVEFGQKQVLEHGIFV